MPVNPTAPGLGPRRPQEALLARAEQVAATQRIEYQIGGRTRIAGASPSGVMDPPDTVLAEVAVQLQKLRVTPGEAEGPPHSAEWP